MVLYGALPFFGSYVEAYTHLLRVLEVIPFLDELAYHLDDLAYG
jgi:hypothetical protein